MPTMPRVKKYHGTKIAYKVLGVPANLAHKPTPEQKALDKRLTYEETFRSR